MSISQQSKYKQSLAFHIRWLCVCSVYNSNHSHCHSNKTNEPIWKLFQGAQLDGIPKRFQMLHWNTCNSVGMHCQTDTQTCTPLHFMLICPTWNVIILWHYEDSSHCKTAHQTHTTCYILIFPILKASEYNRARDITTQIQYSAKWCMHDRRRMKTLAQSCVYTLIQHKLSATCQQWHIISCIRDHCRWRHWWQITFALQCWSQCHGT